METWRITLDKPQLLCLDLELMKPMIEKFHSEAALDVAMLKTLIATFCSLGLWAPSVNQYWSGFLEPFISI